MANPEVPSFELTMPDGSKSYVAASALGYTVPTKPTTPTLNPQVTTTADTITIAWAEPLTEALYGRDGQDASGYGAWASVPGQKSPQKLTGLKPSTAYTITLSGKIDGKLATYTKSVTTAAASTSTPAPSTGASTLAGNPRGFKAFTFGQSVQDAADGDANTWIGKKFGHYSTWGGVSPDPTWSVTNSGKPWGILGAGAEYGQNKVALLGDFDLDIAPQFYVNYAEVADNPNHAFYAWFEQRVQELKDNWGTNRSGRLFYRPFHEFNGDWYKWSTRNATDQANFVKTWRLMRAVWDNVINGDIRYHLVWSPNRDSKYGLDVRNAFPGSDYVDAIGVDYYDYGVPGNNTMTDADWDVEKVRTQNGGPVGLWAWRGYAEGKGLPIYLPESGVQFGDQVKWLQKVIPYVKDNGYSGTDSPAGKFLAATWHNLYAPGGTPDPNATSGNFLIHVGTSNYSGKPQASSYYKQFLQQYTWRQAV